MARNVLWSTPATIEKADSFVMTEQISNFCQQIQLLGVELAGAHHRYGPRLTYSTGAKVMGVAVHTLNVWKSTKKHPELEYHTDSRRAFVSVRGIIKYQEMEAASGAA